jgi:23S rRNA pseudouridine1911/1915/1917 synthase
VRSTTQHLPFRILYEDQHLVAVDKPPGLITSSGPRDTRGTLVELLRHHYARFEPRARIGLIHRLDKDASGVIVFAKNRDAFHHLKHQFRHHSAGRNYVALCDGVIDPPHGRIDNHLLELADGRVVSTRNKIRGDRAITHYYTVETRPGRCRLAVRLETGRKHQIRTHLASRRCPIAGDVLYNPRPADAPRLMLHARHLELIHPQDGEHFEIISPIPQVLLKWWD